MYINGVRIKNGIMLKIVCAITLLLVVTVICQKQNKNKLSNENFEIRSKSKDKNFEEKLPLKDKNKNKDAPTSPLPPVDKDSSIKVTKTEKQTGKVVPTQYKDPLTVTNVTEIDMTIGGIDVGTIRMGLFGDTYPVTVRNHVHLCNYTYGYGYRNAIFHRCIKNFMIQGGDYEYANGVGGHSIYVVDGHYVNFADEDMSLVKHYGAGFVSMANFGPNTNGAQFVIQTVVTPWLDGHHIVFGKVLQGMRIVNLIQNIRTDNHDRPFMNVTIKACRVIALENPFTVDKEPVSLDQM